MEKVFLDTNVFIDLAEYRRGIRPEMFEGYTLLISPLSAHILAYIYKYKMPNNKLDGLLKKIVLVSFDEKILHSATNGPTEDLEDNIQLHSAVEAECDFFLTDDEPLQKMQFFGKTKIIGNLK